MQVKRVVVTLDPEYIPWETEVVRLRRKRTKLGKLAPFLVVGVLMLAFGVLTALQPTNAPAAILTPAPSTGAPSTPMPIPTAPLRVAGAPGKLTIVQNARAMFYSCREFIVSEGATVIASGNTDAGPVLDLSNQRGVQIVCDNQGFALD